MSENENEYARIAGARLRAEAAERDEEADEREFVIYFANLFTKTNRHETVFAASENEARQRGLTERAEHEVVAHVEECRERRFRVMIERVQIIRTFIKADSMASAVEEAQHRVDEGADADWEVRGVDKVKVISVEEA